MTTNEDSAVDNNDFIGHGSSTSKYLLLKVPSYEDSVGSVTGTALYQAAKDTYLNLGRGMGQGASSSAPGWPATSGSPASPTWTEEGLAPGALTHAKLTPPQTSGEDLLAFFGGFIDDKRLRSTGGTFNPHGTPPNENAARTAAVAVSSPTATASATGAGRNLQVTKLIPDYVGWRDHTDGHRITTTRGDKIEIIGGNYKLVSLGRGTGVASLEMSGGLTVSSDEAPGNTTSVTYRPVPTVSTESGWKVVEQVVKGNSVARFHGTKREEFYGDKLISVIGSPDEASSGLTVGDGQNGDGEVYVGGTTAATSTTTVSSWNSDLSSYAYPTKWDQEDDVPPKLQRPEIHQSTWAASVSEYTRVEGASKAQNHYKGDHEERNIFEQGHKTETTMHGAGDYYQEVWHFLGSGGFLERFEGSFLQIFTGSSTTLGLANRFELYVSIEEQLNLGLVTSLSLGAKIDGSFPVKAQVDLTEDKAALEAAEARLTKMETGISDQTARVDSVKAILSDKKLALSRTSKALVTSL
jgi:hypothetical protein